MSTTIDLGNLRFQFNPSWQVKKTDDEGDLQKIKRIQGTKDADIVGLYNNQLYFIEVTDLREYRIENKKKLTHGGMVQEFAQKIRDTIPSIVGAFHSTEHSDTWVPFMESLGNREEKIRLILWMEQDTPDPYSQFRYKQEMDTFKKSFKQKLDWLTPRVMVESQQTYKNNLDFSVHNL